MKPVPDHIKASGPPGTVWFGGPVDRSTMALRVMAKEHRERVDKFAIATLLGCESDRENHKHWCLHARECKDADLDSQVASILRRVTSDLETWKMIQVNYHVDIFCGLFMERPNRSVGHSSTTMADLSARGIEINFDIYAPEENNEAQQP